MKEVGPYDLGGVFREAQRRLALTQVREPPNKSLQRTLPPASRPVGPLNSSR